MCTMTWKKTWETNEMAPTAYGLEQGQQQGDNATTDKENQLDQLFITSLPPCFLVQQLVAPIITSENDTILMEDNRNFLEIILV